MEKNLFDYANKELSQDGFLEWLMQCANSEDSSSESEEEREARKIARRFIRFLCDSSKSENDWNAEDIKMVKTWRQWKNMDLSAEIYLKDGKKYGLVIEDKTASFEHNQLEKYNKSIDAWMKDDVFKVYYKTCSRDFIWNGKGGEIERVKNAGWVFFDLETIEAFWKDYKNSKNMIIRMYSQHLGNLLKRYENRKLPKVDNDDPIEWEGFFKGIWNDFFHERTPQMWTSQITTYGYSDFCFRYGNWKTHECVPFIEIRSRDCCKKTDNDNERKFRAILIRYYGAEQNKIDDKADFEDIRERIDKTEEKAAKEGREKIFKKQGSDKQNKQVGKTEGLTYKNKEEFVANVEKVMKRYLEIMEGYKEHTITGGVETKKSSILPS